MATFLYPGTTTATRRPILRYGDLLAGLGTSYPAATPAIRFSSHGARMATFLYPGTTTGTARPILRCGGLRRGLGTSPPLPIRAIRSPSSGVHIATRPATNRLVQPYHRAVASGLLIPVTHSTT